MQIEMVLIAHYGSIRNKFRVPNNYSNLFLSLSIIIQAIITHNTLLLIVFLFIEAGQWPGRDQSPLPRIRTYTSNRAHRAAASHHAMHWVLFKATFRPLEKFCPLLS